ncbi:hypothetical protein JZ751_009542, partial [Albula glossodonta]
HEFTTTSQKTYERLNFRKAGTGVYHTVVFQAEGATLTDVHRFCQSTCSQESCCDGFILNQNILSGGLQYNKQRMQFTFSFGGQNFNITDAALPPTSKNKTDYQATIIGFERIYLWRDSDMTTRQKSPTECAGVSTQLGQRVPIPDGVKEGFKAVDSTAVRVDSSRNIPNQQYWIFKHHSSAEEAQLWCLQRCEEEELCHVADIRDDGPSYFTCALYPNTQVCGAYDTPLRQPCSLVLPQPPQKAHRKQ